MERAHEGPTLEERKKQLMQSIQVGNTIKKRKLSRIMEGMHK